MKSNTDKDEPSLTEEKIERPEPNRVYVRQEIEDPTCTKSNNDIADPNRA
jgi:hypothetical protein